MPETTAPAVDFSADTDLITFMKAIPDGLSPPWGALPAVVPAAGG